MGAAGTPGLSLVVPTELTLRVGERVAIPLISAGSVGYVWRLAVSGDVQAIDARTGPEHPRSPDAPPGGSLPQALFVSGLGPGHSSIRLELVRVPGRPSRESHDIAVTVVP